MGYVLFLISLLVSTIYYLRVIRKFESFDVRVTEDLHREMNGLILDFNQTANQNIGILEDRMFQGKVLIEEISEQLGYLKKLRDTLGEEIRELQKRKLEIEDQISTLTSREENFVAVESYKRVEDNLRKAKVTMGTLPNGGESKKTVASPVVSEETLDVMDVTQEAVLFSQSLFSNLTEEEKPHIKPKAPQSKVTAVKNNRRTRKTNSSSTISKNEESVGTKEKILAHSHAGKNIEEISRILGITKGEVELVIKLYQSAG